MRRLLYLLPVCIIALLIAVPKSALAGCCSITTTINATDTSSTVYINTPTEQECTNRNGYNVRATYASDQQTVNGDKCTPASSGSKAAQQAKKPLLPQLQVSIPGFKGFSQVLCDDEHPDCSTPWLAEYIRGLYDYGLIIIGLASVIMIMIGGVMWLTARGNREQIGSAQAYIKGSVLGITLAVCSYIILFLLNPNLTVLSPLSVGHIQRQELPEGFSEKENGSESSNNDSTQISGTAPQGCPDQGKIIAITTANTGAASITASEKIWLPESVEQFKKVVKIAKEKYGIEIRIASALRSLKHQQSLFDTAVKKYGSESAARKWVAKPSCNSPHVRGVAVDAWAVPENSANQAKLQKAFQDAGWQRYCAESWHFQIPSAPPNIPCSP